MLNKSIKDVFRRNRKEYPDNAVGIEVEVEFQKGWTPQLNTYYKWLIHQDGSLVNGLELVSLPTDLFDKEQANLVKFELTDFFKNNRVVYSERASTHVHFNCLNRTVMNVLCMVVGYYIIENILFYVTNHARRGNHFCLGLSDSMMNIDTIVRRLENTEMPFIGQEYKYSSLNIGRLGDFGTIESRIMHGLTDAESVIEWGQTVSKLFQNLSEGPWRTPSDVLHAYYDDPLKFITDIVPANVLAHVVSVEHKDLEALCRENLAILLPMNKIDWEKVKKDYNSSWSDATGLRPKRARAQDMPAWAVAEEEVGEDGEFEVGEDQPDFDEGEVAEVAVRPFDWERIVGRVIQRPRVGDFQ